MPIQEDYAIKNELDNDFMSPHLMNSPIINDYSNINVNVMIFELKSDFL